MAYSSDNVFSGTGAKVRELAIYKYMHLCEYMYICAYKYMQRLYIIEMMHSYTLPM